MAKKPGQSVSRSKQSSSVPRSRPLGITILAALEVVSFAGVLLSLPYVSFPLPGDVVGVISIIISIFVLIFSLPAAYGFLTGKDWGWKLGIILYAASILSGVLSLALYGPVISQEIATVNTNSTYNATTRGAIDTFVAPVIYSEVALGLIVDMAFIYYLTRPRVKAWFGIARVK